ncbi:MAG: DNA polymerase III subunit gamma/tau [Firmicutes bacterium]|nr:DNA polymerase III subunit gamma/tau [Bacillota bacterium]
MGYVALYREWRPQTFSEVVGQQHVTRTLINAVVQGRIAHAYLFCGPRGTGKTSVAKILAKVVNCLDRQGAEPCNHCENCLRITQGISMDVLEIDAASNRGIDEIRDLREKIKFAPTSGKAKVYIIDEVHMLTPEAFNALLKTLEEPPAQAMFVLATTEPHKIPATILSRCQRFDFRRVGLKDMIDRLVEIASHHGFNVTPAALRRIARAAEGGMRDALSILDQCVAYTGENVTEDDVNTVLGVTGDEARMALVDCLVNQDIHQALIMLDNFITQGKDIRQIVKELVEYLRNLLLVQIGGDAEALLPVDPDLLNRMKEQAEQLGQTRIMNSINVLTNAEAEMRWTTSPRWLLEVALLKIAKPVHVESIAELKIRVERLEQLVQNLSSVAVPLKTPTRKEATLHGTGPATSSQGRKSEYGRAVIEPARTVEPLPSPVVSPSEVVEKWPLLLETVKKAKIAAHAFLIVAEPVGVTGDVVTVAFKPGYNFHKEKTEQPEIKATIEKCLEAVYKRPLRLRCILQDVTVEPNPVNSKPEDDPLVKQAIELFGPTVIEIKE